MNLLSKANERTKKIRLRKNLATHWSGNLVTSTSPLKITTYLGSRGLAACSTTGSAIALKIICECSSLTWKKLEEEVISEP